MTITLTVDGIPRTAEISAGESLMDVLRRLGFKSVKNGCDNGDCGSCAVLLDGRAVNACLVFAVKADGCRISTVESLATAGSLHPLQRTAVDLGGIQCGFCTPGILILAADLLTTNARPSETEVREVLSGNYCRCTGYTKQVEAILAAAAEMREGAE